MTDALFLSDAASREDASEWVVSCAARSGWEPVEAERLATCVADSAKAVSERAYRLRERGPVFVKLDIRDDAAILELHHEGALGDRPCDCAAAQVATERESTNWKDAQLRTHRLRIAR